MNYATTVDPDLSVRPLYDQSLHCKRIEGANSISEKKCMHMLIWNYNCCTYY